MPQEPAWLQAIPKNYICVWFYILAIINTIFAVALIILSIVLVVKSIKPYGFLFFSILSGLLAFTNGWALFAICSRIPS